MATDALPPEIDIVCPHCGYNLNKTIERLKRKPFVPCPGCYAIIKVKAEWLQNGSMPPDETTDLV